MDYEALFAHLRAALGSIEHPRFFETERGFQGELRAKLEAQNLRELLPHDAIIELEYQKRLKVHGIDIRPDMVIHEPFDAGRYADRKQGNLAVIELKLNASAAEAEGDFESLMQMVKILEYPIGIFINIGSEATLSYLVPANAKGRIVCYAVSMRDGRAHVVEDRA